RPSLPVGPVPGQPSPGEQSAAPAQQLGSDIRAVLGSLTRHVAKLESDNDRLRRDNDRLRAQVKRLRDQMQAISGQIARQVGELLASTGTNTRPTTSSASSTTAPALPSPLQVGDRDDSADARGHVKGALRASYAIGVRRPLIWEPLTGRAISEEDGESS